MKSNFLNILPWIALIAFIFTQRCETNKQISTMQEMHESEISFLKEESKQTMSYVGLVAEKIVESKQNVVSEEQAERLLKDQADEFKSITSHLRGELVTAVKGIQINYASPDIDLSGITLYDGNYIHKDTVSRLFLRTPKEFKYGDDWVKMDGTITQNALVFDSIYVFNKFDATLGYKKPDKSFKFLRKSEPVLTFKSYSPYTDVPYLNNLTVQDNRSGIGKILTSRPAFFGYGFLANSLLMKSTGR